MSRPPLASRTGFRIAPRVALAACALASLAVSLPAAAQWKWRDRGGLTQYSDMPPPASVPDADILQRPLGARRVPGVAPVAVVDRATPAAPASAASAPRGDPALEAKRREQDAKAKADADAKKRAEDERLAAAKADTCARARDQQRTLDSGIRIARVNANGEREFLDDAARAAEQKRAQGLIADNCR